MDLKRTSDEAKNGVVETYYGNGQLESRETWGRAGNLAESATYKDGIKQ